MDLTQFNISILKKFDRTLENKVERAVQKATLIEDDISTVELKGMLCEALKLNVLDSHTNQVIRSLS